MNPGLSAPESSPESTPIYRSSVTKQLIFNKCDVLHVCNIELENIGIFWMFVMFFLFIDRDVNSREIAFTGRKSLFPGLNPDCRVRTGRGAKGRDNRRTVIFFCFL